MTSPDLDQALRQTLADRQLSRGERRALRALLEDEREQWRELGVLRSRAFAIATEALHDPRDAQILEWLQEVLGLAAHVAQPESHGDLAEARFSPGEDCLEMIRKELDFTRQRADICVFTITDDRITRAIERAADRGVRLRLLSDDEKAWDAGSDIERLRARGIPVAVDSSPAHMHHKFAIFDGARLLTGSYNWTRSAAQHNEENLVLSDDRRLLSAFQQEFDKLWHANASDESR